MRKIVMFFTAFCVFFWIANIDANADIKTICLHNKGGYIAKLLVYNGNMSSYTHIYETDNITAGFTKCVQIPPSVTSIEIIAHGEGMGTMICGSVYTDMASFPDNVTITTKGTIFGASCEGLP